MRFHRFSHALVALVTLAVVVATACQQAPAAPAPTTAPAAQQAVAAGPVGTKLIVAVDVVQGSTNLTDEQKAVKSCVLTSRFPRNSQIVWRARVSDPRTSDAMDDKALKGVQVKLANGTSIDMKYGPHDNGADTFWTGSWKVPKDYATGTLDYSVLATGNDDRSGTWKPFKVSSSLLTILSDVIPDVAAAPKPAASPAATPKS